MDVGETSALSFLHFLRKTVKAYVGSVPFTDSERHHIVVDMDHCSSISVNVDSVEREKLHVWMGFYNDAVSEGRVKFLLRSENFYRQAGSWISSPSMKLKP